MGAVLIRHADAGRRGSMDDDTLRPLSPRGYDQAAAMVEVLADRTLGPIVASPYLRCQQTVAPLAAAAGTEVTVDERLAEGRSPDVVVEWIVAHDGPSDLVLCGHGDVLPEVLRLLALRGVELSHPAYEVPKGSVWLLELTDERSGSGTLLYSG